MFKLKNVFILALAGLFAFSSCAKETVTADYGVVPLPQNITAKEGTPFVLNNSTLIVYVAGNEKMKKTAELLSDYLKLSAGLTLAVSDKEQAENAIVLKADYSNENKEAYTLIVNAQQIVINGVTEAGTFYGIQTLYKSIPANSDGKNVNLPGVEIVDYPRFSYRGAMLDVGRHMFPLDFVKKYIDVLALHNINRLHWHLTDDQGWRFEVKKHPKLTEIGSQRKETVIGKNTGEYDGKPYGGYYTQEEAKEVVAYAAERFITVIPEIDLPGHMLAALHVYPELGCTGGPYEVSREWGVFEDVLCVGNENVFSFLEDVYTELIEVFPSKYIHVGGDECPKVKWKTCPKCQAKIKQLGLKADKGHSAEDKLQSYCISRMEKFLNSKGRDIIGWDEILEGGLAPNATVMSWRGVDGGVAAAKQKHDAIMTPTNFLYFDYFQTNNPEKENHVGIGGFVPLDKVYSFEPVSKELTAEEAKYIIGVQCNLWTEYITSSNRAEFQLMPRVAALSEVQWTMPENKNYPAFLLRLNSLIKIYDKRGYNYAKYVFDIQAQVTPNAEKGQVDVVLSTFDNAPVYYTLDGTEPTTNSLLYASPLAIKEALTLKAVAIREGGNSELYVEQFDLNKATFKNITSKVVPHHRYTYEGISKLVDGAKGGNAYGDGKWLGFNNNGKVEVVIDMKDETEVSNAKIGTFVSTGDWIFGCTGLAVAVSADGKKYTEVSAKTYPDAAKAQVAGRVDITADFDKTKARYVKVTVSKTNSIPDWHREGKGAVPFIFIDEIEVY